MVVLRFGFAIFFFEKRWSSAVLNFRNLPRLFTVKVTVRVRLRIGGDTAISWMGT